jgi:2,3-bisphosphoglycerate-independent phosphoglycerate mutase
VASIEESYENNVTDEFIDPIVMNRFKWQTMATIEEDDVVFS